MTGPPSRAVTIEAAVTGATAVIVVTGDLDLASTQLLARRLDEVLSGRPQRAVFCLAGVGFIDCAAARLIAGAGRFLPSGQRPVIEGASPAVRRVLTLTGLAARCEMRGRGGETADT
jgi:anti-anti-sigma factor